MNSDGDRKELHVILLIYYMVEGVLLNPPGPASK